MVRSHKTQACMNALTFMHPSQGSLWGDSLHSQHWNPQRVAVPESRGQASNKKGTGSLLIQSAKSYYCVAAPTMCRVLRRTSPVPLYYSVTA